MNSFNKKNICAIYQNNYFIQAFIVNANSNLNNDVNPTTDNMYPNYTGLQIQIMDIQQNKVYVNRFYSHKFRNENLTIEQIIDWFNNAINGKENYCINFNLSNLYISLIIKNEIFEIKEDLYFDILSKLDPIFMLDFELAQVQCKYANLTKEFEDYKKNTQITLDTIFNKISLLEIEVKKRDEKDITRTLSSVPEKVEEKSTPDFTKFAFVPLMHLTSGNKNIFNISTIN